MSVGWKYHVARKQETTMWTKHRFLMSLLSSIAIVLLLLFNKLFHLFLISSNFQFSGKRCISVYVQGKTYKTMFGGWKYTFAKNNNIRKLICVSLFCLHYTNLTNCIAYLICRLYTDSQNYTLSLPTWKYCIW